MLIDFETIAPVEKPNFKGGEGMFVTRAFDDGQNRIISARLLPGSSIGAHVHDDSMEVMMFTAGTGMVVCDGKEEPVSAGSCHYCPKGSSHVVTNTGSDDLVMYCIVAKQ